MANFYTQPIVIPSRLGTHDVAGLSPGGINRDILHRRCTASSPKGEYPPQATEIIPRLFISDLYTATDPSFLMSHRITHRLSIQLEPVEPPFSNFAMKTKHIALADKSEARIWMYLESAADWIEAALHENAGQSAILVHCSWGKSRSVAVVIAFLMKYRGMGLNDALAYIQMRRPIAQPNPGFMKQLQAYEEGMRKWEQRSLL